MVPSKSNIIFKTFETLNQGQLDSIKTTEGPLLIIAGPGSGKSLVLILRTLYILMENLAKPKEILLCTFTEKAAYELKERITIYANKMGYKKDLTDLRISTIHSFCNNYLKEFKHKTRLGNNFDVLDELTQYFFIFEHFDMIIGTKLKDSDRYLGKWKNKWTTIQKIVDFFNKITEELINPEDLISNDEKFLNHLGNAYKRYKEALFTENKLDFSHQQKEFYELLSDPEVYNEITTGLKYLMIDEYQDTNYIQEQIFLKITSNIKNNLCVVGDDDQSLYRFRGATVRNILEFKNNFPIDLCKEFKLLVNYRSHKNIIEMYQEFINSISWKDAKTGTQFRHDKKIIENKEVKFANYPAVFSIWGMSETDEGTRVADLIAWLYEKKVIEDYSQIAILLSSVKHKYSKHYIDALNLKGIKTYCPRARNYFENEEVKNIIGCFVFIFNLYDDLKKEIETRDSEFQQYLIDCLVFLAEKYPFGTPLANNIATYYNEINKLGPSDTTDYSLIDLLYGFITSEPFLTYLKKENSLRNLGIFSQLLNIFHQYYKYNIITGKNREGLKKFFFYSFLNFLYNGGINEYEDDCNPIPKEHVQIMTIHQSKGLEFSVVIAGSLNKRIMVTKQIDKLLSQFYHRAAFEPLDRITEFDRMRLFYVAFSRAKHNLVLSTDTEPKDYFKEVWEGLPQWPYVQKDLLKVLDFEFEEKLKLKKIFSLTSQVNIYETCPRQYKFFKEYEFVPSRSAQMLFGTLVHETLEDVNREVIIGNKSTITDDKIEEALDFNYIMLLKLGFAPINPAQIKNALGQCINYFHENYNELDYIKDVELKITLERPDYILNGVIDVVKESKGEYEIWDFKTQQKTSDKRVLEKFQRQLNTYAYLLKKKIGADINKLAIYWTNQKKKTDALTEFSYDESLISSHINNFDEVVDKILKKDFSIVDVPENKTCNECDLKKYCLVMGTITLK